MKHIENLSENDLNEIKKVHHLVTSTNNDIARNPNLEFDYSKQKNDSEWVPRIEEDFEEDDGYPVILSFVLTIMTMALIWYAFKCYIKSK